MSSKTKQPVLSFGYCFRQHSTTTRIQAQRNKSKQPITKNNNSHNLKSMPRVLEHHHHHHHTVQEMTQLEMWGQRRAQYLPPPPPGFSTQISSVLPKGICHWVGDVTIPWCVHMHARVCLGVHKQELRPGCACFNSGWSCGKCRCVVREVVKHVSCTQEANRSSLTHTHTQIFTFTRFNYH